ncbi:hypothetical protein [Oleiagrimonas soli]|uniref:DNA polymerase III subunit psi n=1 Tax=Oleiagrimonas soli TaxID=1543381 RepID=A0A099CYH3_9GAMM|nr:hypothetical protein [Oleiagrimonas soli]KGI78736.1 hypothetical protein LF63_0103920 [Oleiagrimonas soli]MBB6184102.1 hypothetical protein [Oleiagrimonas soli]
MATASRHERLRALGVTPYRLRAPRGVEAVPAEPSIIEAAVAPTATPRAAGATVPCVLLLPAGCPPRTLDLIGRSMHAFGADFARAPRFSVSTEGVLDTPPTARAYLAFGDAQARALGHVLDADVMHAAEIVLLDLPEALHAGASKRRLWLALKALRRRMRAH